jgi:predicted ATP-grasp superfamily ATP-dependent carboligase
VGIWEIKMKQDLVIFINCARDHYDVCKEVRNTFPNLVISIVWTDEKTKNLIYNLHKSDTHSYNFEEVYSEDLIQHYIKNYNILAVIPSGDDSVDLALRLQNRLTPKTSNSLQTIEIIADKNCYLDLLNSYGIVKTKQYKLDNIESFPVVIKPKFSKGGSENVWIVKNIDQIPNDINYDDFVAQEYINGIEYTIDMASINGEHHLLLASKYDKFKDELWQYKESIVNYSKERYLIQDIFEYLSQCLDALDWKFGITCAQVIVGKSIDLVEINFRKHGHINDNAVEKSTGIKLSTHMSNIYLAPEIFKNRIPMYDYYQPYDRFWVNIEKETYIENLDWSNVEALDSYIGKIDHCILFSFPGLIKKSTSMLSSFGMVSMSHHNKDIYERDVSTYFEWWKKSTNNL